MRKRRRVIFLDRDGTINERANDTRYITKWEDFKFLPDAIDAMKILYDSGFEIFLVTNQAGIGRGVMSLDDLEEIHAKMQEKLSNCGVLINRIYFCPHSGNDGCICRKPNIGLFLKAAEEYNIDLSGALFVGDDETDLQAGQNAGIMTYLITDKTSLFDIACNILNPKK
jgi:histidinol-phosphate phosphatase family protein